MKYITALLALINLNTLLICVYAAKKILSHYIYVIVVAEILWPSVINACGGNLAHQCHVFIAYEEVFPH